MKIFSFQLLRQLTKYFSGIKHRQENLLLDALLEPASSDFPPRCGPELNLSRDADLQVKVSQHTSELLLTGAISLGCSVIKRLIAW